MKKQILKMIIVVSIESTLVLGLIACGAHMSGMELASPMLQKIFTILP